MEVRRNKAGSVIPDTVPEHRKLEIWPAVNPPKQDGRLVVGWRNDWPLPCVYEWRQTKKAFYSNAMPVTIDVYVYLEDLTGSVQTAKAILFIN